MQANIQTGISLPEDLPGDGKPSLGNYATVSQLVADFAQGVIAIRNDFHAGKPGAEDAPGRIEQLAKEAGDKIMGRDPAYHTMPWQVPHRLGARLSALLDEAAKFEPGQALFVWLAKQVLTATMAVEAGRVSPEDSARSLQPVLSDVADRITGVKV